MKIETTENKITIILEDEKVKDIHVSNRNYGEETNQIWIKLISNGKEKEQDT